VGELGYELYIPAEQATHVYDRVVEAGREFGLVHAGLKALASLRMEKGYRDYGHDIDNTDVPYETGLGFALDLRKPGGFIGKEAVLAQKAKGPLTPPPRPGACEGSRAAHVPRRGCAPRRRSSRYVSRGIVRPYLGGAVGLVMIEPKVPVDEDFLNSGEWQVDIAGRLFPAMVSAKPLYDPESKRSTPSPELCGTRCRVLADRFQRQSDV